MLLGKLDTAKGHIPQSKPNSRGVQGAETFDKQTVLRKMEFFKQNLNLLV